MYPNRESLRFPELVKKIFGFLENNYNFVCFEENATYVRYETNEVFVVVFHGRNSYEIGLQIGLHEIRSDRGFGIEVLISLHDEEYANQFQYKVGRTKKQIEEYLLDLSKLLIKYGNDALRGDKSVFMLMQKEIDEYWKRKNAVRVKIKASEAFKYRDYKKVVSLYESINEFLVESERKKLAYARKKCT